MSHGSISFGPEHLGVATTLMNIATVYKDQGLYSKALEMHEKSLKIKTKIVGHNHPDVAATQDNIGIVLQKLLKLPEALEMHEKALKTRLAVLGPDHLLAAITKTNIGNVLLTQGKFPEAKEMFEQATKVQAQQLGEHPDTSTSMMGVALVLQKMGKNLEALAKFSEVLRIQEKVLGRDHLLVAKTYNKYAHPFSVSIALHSMRSVVCSTGIVLLAMGKHEKALENYNKSLEIKIRALGHDHPDVAAAQVL